MKGAKDAQVRRGAALVRFTTTRGLGPMEYSLLTVRDGLNTAKIAASRWKWEKRIFARKRGKRMCDYPMPSWANHPTSRVRLLRSLRGDFPIGHTLRADARIYETDEIYLNPHGAVSVLTPNGWLGVKPNEMEWCA